MGWPKSSFSFKVKIKDTFLIFTKNFIELHIHCHFLGNFIIPSSQNFLSFWAKNCSRWLLQSSRNWSLLHWENFVETEIKGKLKVQSLVNMVDESELPSQGVATVAWSSKKHAVLYYPDGRLCVFNRKHIIPGTFGRVLLSVNLTGSSTCGN